MTYEVYKTIKNKKEYYSTWEPEQVRGLSVKLSDEIYNKYIVKCEVFNRDNFKCQNMECITPDSDLTIHHVKWKKNGGKDTARNTITICDRCHKKYHRAKISLVFNDIDTLPSHIRGHTISIHTEDGIDWKVLKRENKLLRREYRGINNSITWEYIYHLMKWLYEPMV